MQVSVFISKSLLKHSHTRVYHLGLPLLKTLQTAAAMGIHFPPVPGSLFLSCRWLPLHLSSDSLPPVCVHDPTASSLQDTSHTGLGPAKWPHLNLNKWGKALSPHIVVTWRFWGLGLQHINLGGHISACGCCFHTVTKELRHVTEIMWLTNTTVGHVSLLIVCFLSGLLKGWPSP